MIDIKDIKQHIRELFCINEPFDLFLNEVEYLPPNEDIRILKDNETVLVLPDSQLSNIQLSSTQLRNQLDLPINIPVLSVDTRKQELENSSAYSEQIEQKLINSLKSAESLPQHEHLPINIPVSSSSSTQQEYMADVADKSENGKENVETYVCAKRKRARCRKKQQKVDQPLLNEEDKFSKSKVMNSKVIPLGKHIRFDKADDKICMENQITCADTTNGPHSTISPVDELKNLLSLVNNSSPLTFENNRIKDKTDAKNLSDKVNEANTSQKSVSESKASTKELAEAGEFMNTDLETYPIMTAKPKINDVIAFKMLKIGSDYTPQVSNFIIGEVVSCCQEKSLYIFKVLQGLSEIQVPIGKLTSMEELDERVMNDTITLNYAQIMKPRLVSTSSTRCSFPLTC